MSYIRIIWYYLLHYPLYRRQDCNRVLLTSPLSHHTAFKRSVGWAHDSSREEIGFLKVILKINFPGFMKISFTRFLDLQNRIIRSYKNDEANYDRKVTLNGLVHNNSVPQSS